MAYTYGGIHRNRRHYIGTYYRVVCSRKSGSCGMCILRCQCRNPDCRHGYSIDRMLLYMSQVDQTTARRNATNADRLFGEEAVVIKEINTLESKGQVKVRGDVWSAKTSDPNKVIPEGAKVKVIKTEGVKLLVEEIKEA